MSSDVLLTVDRVVKEYAMFRRPEDRLKQMIFGRFGAKCYYTPFRALDDISLTVRRGETIGIVGRNGSGKSTLLQLIAGTLTQTCGTIERRGRIAPLLQLGAGFSPEFSGRENILLSATLLGLSGTEARALIPEIIEFADIGDFIDQPVKTYSSGMFARLAFAVASAVSPDLLIVDEILAVGDAKFQRRCFERIKTLQRAGTSILFVSHATDQIVSLCTRAILLDQGKMLMDAEPRAVVNRYLDILFGRGRDDQEKPVAAETAKATTAALSLLDNDDTTDLYATRPCYNHLEYRWGDGRAQILDAELAAGGKSWPTQIDHDADLTLTMKVHFADTILRPIFGLNIKLPNGTLVYGTNSELKDVDVDTVGAAGDICLITFTFKAAFLPGDYFLSLGVASHHGGELVPHDRRYDSLHIVVAGKVDYTGAADLNAEVRCQLTGSGGAARLAPRAASF